MNIKAGTVLLFNSFTGLNVFGSLIVEGTPEKPVIFTSINDNFYNEETEQLPNPFDWNGIHINAGAGDVKFRNFKLMYSVYGIKSQKEDIIIQNGTFKQNGQFHFTIKDNIYYVQDNLSYSYEAQKTETTRGKNIKPEKEPDLKARVRKEKPKRHPALIIAAISSATIGVGCGSASAYFWNQKSGYHDKYLNSRDQANIDHYYEKENTAYTRAGILTGFSAVLVPASVVLFLIRPKSKKHSRAFIDTNIGKDRGAITLSVRF